MRYKGIISDFDGTIAHINEHLISVVSSEVRNAIKTCIGKKVPFALATGRPYKGAMEQFCHDVGITTPCIVHGGGRIINPLGGETLWEEPLSSESAQKIVNYLRVNSLPFHVETEDIVYTDHADFAKKIFGIYSMRPTAEYKGEKAYKILLYAYIAKLNERQIGVHSKNIEMLASDIHPIVIRVGEFYGMDVTSLRGTKQTAVVKWCDITGIERSEIIGVGDGNNDYPLLNACGLKIAMGNAGSELKELADFIAPSVDKDGLVTVLKTFF